LAVTPHYAFSKSDSARRHTWQSQILANEFKCLRIRLWVIERLAPVLLIRDWEVEKHLTNPKPT
jgi:hypothetical protein